MLNNPKFYAIATVILWSAFAPLAKMVSKSQFLYVTLSFAFTTLTFLSILAYRMRLELFSRLRAMKPQYLFFGLFGYFIYWIGLIQSFREFSSASGTTVLNYTWPVFTVIFTEMVFRRTVKAPLQRAVEAVGILLGFGAVFVLATKGQIWSFEITHARGLAWGLLAGASYGFFSAYSGSVPREFHGVFLLTSAVVSLAAMLPFAWTELDMLRRISPRDFLFIFLLGSAVDGGGYFLWTSANLIAREQNVDISTVSSIAFFLPLISVIIVSILLGEGEIFRPYFAVTLVLLISGSVICQKTREITIKLQSFYERKQSRRRRQP
ncbi:MAG: DMT family transporter [Pseudomonadota bacterium]